MLKLAKLLVTTDSRGSNAETSRLTRRRLRVSQPARVDCALALQAGHAQSQNNKLLGERDVNSQISDLVFIGTGLALMILGIAWRKRLSGQRVVDLTAEKLGLALKADAFGLVVLLGFLIAIASIFLRYQQYESRLTTMVSNREDR